MRECELCGCELTGIAFEGNGKYLCPDCGDDIRLDEVCEIYDITPREILEEMCDLKEVDIEEQEQAEIDDFKYRQFVEDKMTEGM